MKSAAFIVVTLILTQHLRAVIQMQTVTLNTAEVIATGTSSGNADETVEVSFPNIEFVFDQFDPTLGTLDQVTFDVAFSCSSETTSSSLTSADPGFDTNSQINIPVDFFFEDSDLGGAANGGGQTSRIPNEVVELDFGISRTIEPVPGQVDYNDFVGTGTVTFSVDPQESVGIRNFFVSGYFTDYSVQRDAGASLTVTYDYTAVPEPSVYAAGLAMAALGIAWVRRKRS
ncbi:choice-of-anchor E domain-containing protein [Rubellicoccus peritrichatus]|uniref:Choice-of-anchor E domain-containing protein n=1 Tax=Rubellicoccus peritrichatus TaxID=3080537 RepID=A0AAQ3LAU6_9BACT|nr:choice-of-anchor E domain-containing protein [Puniceicoccus sp. CR14]WOO41862.1 choice-of-anchor E domain-containing protein [Puniceicoccus sp. CR14]